MWTEKGGWRLLHGLVTFYMSKPALYKSVWCLIKSSKLFLDFFWCSAHCNAHTGDAYHWDLSVVRGLSISRQEREVRAPVSWKIPATTTIIYHYQKWWRKKVLAHLTSMGCMCVCVTVCVGNTGKCTIEIQQSSNWENLEIRETIREPRQEEQREHLKVKSYLLTKRACVITRFGEHNFGKKKLNVIPSYFLEVLF